RAAILAQQASDFLAALSKADGFFDAVNLITNIPKFMEENATNAYKKVEAQLKKAGGDISKVKVSFEDASILGIDVGKKIVEGLGKITAEDYESMRNMKEQLVR